MVNLVNYYQNNINENDYYYRFYDELITKPKQMEKDLEECFGPSGENYEDNIAFSVYDIDDAINRFKELCDPNLDGSSDDINNKSFYFLAFYLKNNGYYIEEFPYVLDRPPLDHTKFTIHDIRNRAFELELNDDNIVKYQTRRRIVNKLNFLVKSDQIEINDDINSLFEKISTRNAKFENMSSDEKLEAICNLIENTLSKNKKFETLDYNIIGFDYINDEIVRKYRKQIQCFRHASEEALNERKQFSEKQKRFLIDYGIIIIKTIYELEFKKV